MTRTRQILLFGTAAILLVMVLYRYGVFGGGDEVAATHDTIPVAKQRLEILRRKAALVPGKETVLKAVTAELEQREKGIVQGATAEEARVHLADVLHKTAQANGFDTQGAAELPQPAPLGKDYGQVSLGQTFTCGIDQLVNFLSAIANEPELLSTDSIFITPVRNKNKDIRVRLTFSGVVPKKLVPARKGDRF